MRLWPPTLVAAGAIALTLPVFVFTSYWLGVLALVAMYTVASLAQNLLAGYADIPSLGNVAFLAVSAYTAGALIADAHIAVGLALAAGILGAGVLGLAVGLPALRVSGMHLAIVTVALVFAAQELMQNWNQNHNPSGLTVNSPGWLLHDRALYLAAVLLAVLVYLGMYNLLRSRTGRAIVALSENPLAAASAGIDLVRYRLAAFILSGILTGAAGVLYLYYYRTVTPGAFGLDLSLAFLTMMILGGTRSLVGSALGALIIGLLPEILTRLPAVTIGNTTIQQLTGGIYALLLILALRFFPDGIWNGLMTRASSWRRDRPRSSG